MSELPSLSITEISQLPQCSAIYFVVKDYSVVYIGRAINLADRWSSHNKWNQIAKLGGEVKIAWLECSDTTLLHEIELALIQYFRPSLNKLGTGKRSHPDYEQVSAYIRKDTHKKVKNMRFQSCVLLLTLGKSHWIFYQLRVKS